MDDEQILESLKKHGSDWQLLADALKDTDFLNLLRGQDRQLMLNLKSNPNQINGYQDHYLNILFKYIGWKSYTDTKLRELKRNVKKLEEQVSASEVQLEAIRDSAKYIGGATVLVEYSKSFSTTATNHQIAAIKELKWYLGSLAGFAIIVGLVFFVSISDFTAIKKFIAADVQALPLNTGILALKAFLLVFAYQITQFFKKNYSAEKHLQEVYQHRSDVLQSLHAVYNSLSDPKEKDEILRAGALFAYERGETGYITTKEGAGSGDTFFETVFGRIFR